MKDALLWKRILHGGIELSIGSSRSDRERAQSRIITAPIIVNKRSWPERAPESFVGLSFPFPSFWMEGLGYDHSIYSGAYIDTTRGESGDWAARVACVVCSSDVMPTHFADYTFHYVDGEEAFDRKVMLFKNRLGIPENDIGHLAKCIGQTVIDSLVLMGCKNVGLREHDNEPSQVKIAEKRHGNSPDRYHYHTLVVRPSHASKGEPPQEIGIMPRHVCRGHFAEYGEEFGKGRLFGKYCGRFYIPPHLKGDKDNGVVEKDYQIAGGVG